jgi:predicted ArsR family transcriptional regulator
MTDSSLDSTTLVQRLTLIGVGSLSVRDETPAHAGRIVRTCAEQVEAIEGDVVGTVSETEVSRALNELDAAGLVDTADTDDRSPVGKGRPAYELSCEPQALVEQFESDDRIERLLDSLDR